MAPFHSPPPAYTSGRIVLQRGLNLGVIQLLFTLEEQKQEAPLLVSPHAPHHHPSILRPSFALCLSLCLPLLPSVSFFAFLDYVSDGLLSRHGASGLLLPFQPPLVSMPSFLLCTLERVREGTAVQDVRSWSSLH